MLPGYTLYDLTQTIYPTSPAYNANERCTLHTTIAYKQCQSITKFKVQEVCMPAGMGTHMDAPAHAHPEAQTIEQLQISELIFPLFVIDCQHVQQRSNLEIEPADILAFEQTWGKLPTGSGVYLYTGWAKYWQDATQYRSEAADGTLHFPTLSNQSIDLLLERAIACLGIDTLSPDRAPEFYAHAQLLQNKCCIVENLATPKGIPTVGAYIGLFPIPLATATESPIRAIAFVPKA